MGEKKSDLSEFDCGTLVGFRQTALSISITADLCHFYTQQTLEITQNGALKKKNPVSSSSVDEKDQWKMARLLRAV